MIPTDLKRLFAAPGADMNMWNSAIPIVSDARDGLPRRHLVTDANDGLLKVAIDEPHAVIAAKHDQGSRGLARFAGLIGDRIDIYCHDLAVTRRKQGLTPAIPIFVLGAVSRVHARKQPSIHIDQPGDDAIRSKCVPELDELSCKVLCAAEGGINRCMGQRESAGVHGRWT